MKITCLVAAAGLAAGFTGADCVTLSPSLKPRVVFRPEREKKEERNRREGKARVSV